MEALPLFGTGISTDHVTLWQWVQRYAPGTRERIEKELVRK
jgi:transposase-like protein